MEQKEYFASGRSNDGKVSITYSVAIHYLDPGTLMIDHTLGINVFNLYSRCAAVRELGDFPAAWAGREIWIPTSAEAQK